MGLAVVSVASGGLPVVEVTTAGLAVTEAANARGIAVTKVIGKPGLGVTYVSETGGPVPPALSAWNPADSSPNIALSNNNYTAAATTTANGGIRGTRSVATGKFYYEVKVTGTIANCGIGVALASAILNTGNGMVFFNIANGTVFWGGSSIGAAGPGLVSGDVLCVAVDKNNSKIWFRKNGGSWDGTTHDPATNTGGFDTSSFYTPSTPVFTVLYFVGTTGPICTSVIPAFTIPSGFVGWPA